MSEWEWVASIQIQAKSLDDFYSFQDLLQKEFFTDDFSLQFFF